MSTLALPLTHDDPAFDRDGFRREFEAHLARLPALQAHAFRLRELEGLAPARICARLGVSEETLGDLLFEARSAMCRAMARAVARD